MKGIELNTLYLICEDAKIKLEVNYSLCASVLAELSLISEWYELIFISYLNVLQRVSPKEDVEKLILQTGGVKSLIGCLHGISSIHNRKGKGFALAKPFGAEREGSRPCPIPDGLPKTLEELEEEEKGRMPDSPYTRLLRTKGRFPAWYSPAPDHETDW